MVKCRETDVALVENSIPDALKSVPGHVKIDFNVKVDKTNFLPAECSGGVELTVQKGKIRINNTLEARLSLVARKLTPQIRVALFGQNPNRKFFD